jgi:hypothetical protein
MYSTHDMPLYTSQAANEQAYMDLLTKASESDLLRAQNPAYMHLYDKARTLEIQLSAQKYILAPLKTIYSPCFGI